ncbi:MAG: hypothetical protein L3K13_06630 [Thermoplasmata archaeon]|nr:hypothetical protein [Thermoplasmata archaeon]
MDPTPRSGARWVALAQAMIARELIEGLGLSTRRAAELLGVAPSAVSQYLTGHRRNQLLAEFGTIPSLTTIAHRAAVTLSSGAKSATPSILLVLEAAAKIAQEAGVRDARSPPKRNVSSIDRRILRQLRDRVTTEQEAVTASMHLAQKARDELTRAVFRQIASDSLRHAEIVASLAVYLESGTNRSVASGVERSDVEAMILRENEAEKEGSEGMMGGLGGVMKLLAQSMADDEKKHESLLRGLLAEGFAADASASRPATVDVRARRRA